MANVEFNQRIKVLKSGFLKDRHFTDTDIGRFVEPFPNAQNQTIRQTEAEKITLKLQKKLTRTPKSEKISL